MSYGGLEAMKIILKVLLWNLASLLPSNNEYYSICRLSKDRLRDSFSWGVGGGGGGAFSHLCMCQCVAPPHF